MKILYSVFKPIRKIDYLYNRYIKLRQFKYFELTNNAKLYPINTYKNKFCSFFGYYNLVPDNYLNEIIYNYCRNKSNHYTNNIEIVLQKDNKINYLAKSHAWNWQQSCMLQWLPPTSEHIIFNDYNHKTNEYNSRIIDKNGKLKQVFNKPIYSVSKTGEFALTLNFDRLAMLKPAYGYNTKPNISLLPDCEDGIWQLNLNKGTSNIILTIKQLKELRYTSTMDSAKHHVNHIDINPSGTRFIFIHRWSGPNGRFHRLISSNIDGSELYILNGDKMTSHCCWYDDNTIISFCHFKDYGEGYYIFKDKTTDIKLLSNKLPTEDGHPSVSPDKNWLITDTYPDKARMSWLILYNIKKDSVHRLGRFYQPIKYRNDNRIDLHPKWSNSGTNIFFESGHTGIRNFYKLDIGSIINE